MRKTNASGDEVRLPIMYQLTTTDPMVSMVNEHPVRDESFSAALARISEAQRLQSRRT